MFLNVSANWIRQVIALVVSLFLFRFTIDQLGPERTGSWEQIISITGYLSLMVLGVPMASVRAFTGATARADSEELNRAIGSCGVLYTVLGVAALLVSLALYPYFDTFFASRIPDPSEREQARLAFFLVSLFVGTGFFAQLPYGVMAAHHDFVPRNLVLIGSTLLKFALTLVFLRIYKHLPTLAVVLLICQTSEFLVGWRWMLRRYPGARLNLRLWSKETVKGIFAFSLFVMVLNLGSKLAFLTDAQVIGALRPAESARLETTQYEAGNKFLFYFIDVLIGIGAVVMPKATQLQAQGKLDELLPIVRRWFKVAVCLTLPVVAWLLVCGPAFIVWWTNREDFAEPSGRVLRVLMLSALFFLPVRGVALPVLMGLGRTLWATLAFLGMGVANLAISLALVRDMGIVGVALGTAIPNVAFAVCVLGLMARELKASTWGFLLQVLPRPLLAAAGAGAALWAVNASWPIGGFWALFTSGALTMGVFGGLAVAVTLRGDPDLDLWPKIRARLRRG